MSQHAEGSDAFERRYTAGIAAPDPEPPALGAADAKLNAPAEAPAGEPFALRGCVVTPNEVHDPGHVVVGTDGNISAVHVAAPAGVKVLDTKGVILPGLIDLHGHPEFNIFAAWEPPQLFANRYRWRDSPIYKQIVRTPWNALQAAHLDVVATRYAEVRALVGGTTAIQGASPQYPSEEALVRNVDKRIFGAQHARSMIDLPSNVNADLQSILDGMHSGDVKAFYLHLAEGQQGDQRSIGEFPRLVTLGALTPATVVIHGTALTHDQFVQMKTAGAKLVWSPQSNLRLYAQTTNVKDALDLKIPLALGADWLPSGSRSLLDEMRVARRELAIQGATVTAEQLVKMVTTGAASIAGLDDRLGLLAPGRPADILVLERRLPDPWENVLEADPSWVELVTIGGDLSYGREDWMRTIAGDAVVDAAEKLLAWAKPMVLDTSYAVAPHAPPPRLADLRAQLIGGYPQVGPIFA